MKISQYEFLRHIDGREKIHTAILNAVTNINNYQCRVEGDIKHIRMVWFTLC